MTGFYVLLYYIWRIRYRAEGKHYLTASVYVLSAVRVILCLFPNNDWLSADAPVSWGIYRNIPFTILGILLIVLFYNSSSKGNDPAFRFLWLTIVLSFGFYIPVVLFAHKVPLLGLLMMPKTCAHTAI